MLLQELVKEYKLPTLERSVFEDAFDGIELVSFPISCTIFDLLQTKHRGDIKVKDLVNSHKKQVRILAYLISTKQVPIKIGNMYFGIWIDNEGAYFDIAPFSDSFAVHPLQEGGCYLLLGTVEIDYHFPTIMLHKMAKMPFMPDSRYMDTNNQFKTQQLIKEDVSNTDQQPYPQEHEINLPSHRMKF